MQSSLLPEKGLGGGGGGGWSAGAYSRTAADNRAKSLRDPSLTFPAFSLLRAVYHFAPERLEQANCTEIDEPSRKVQVKRTASVRRNKTSPVSSLPSFPVIASDW